MMRPESARSRKSERGLSGAARFAMTLLLRTKKHKKVSGIAVEDWRDSVERAKKRRYATNQREKLRSLVVVRFVNSIVGKRKKGGQ